jgi:CubicO group peptidase (beta-lactamase class C family)
MVQRGSSAVGVAAVLLWAMTAVACSSGSSDGDEPDGSAPAGDAAPETTAAADVVYPGDDWATADPADEGLDPATLDVLAAEAEGLGSNCYLVSRRGRIVGEWYWNGTDETSAQEVFSATKSYGSTLVGIAQDDGDLSIDDPASDYITAWQDTPSESVTVRNLLSNDSGRFWSLGSDYGELITAPDRDAYAVGLDQAADPGTTWAYNNAAIQTLDVVLREATGVDAADFAAERLFEPIGMDDTEMTRDNSGNPLIFMGLQSTCRDMARFGYLFLRDGSWDGEQIVSPEWVADAVGDSSQDLNAAYGFLWWLNRRGAVLDPSRATTAGEGGDQADGQMAPGAPEDMYWALGLGGQVISVDPGSETVVVRLAPSGGAGGFGPTQAAKVVTEALVSP